MKSHFDYPGLFFTFEGPEGAGKSTQIELLSKELSAKGYSVLKLREPGGSLVGDRISDIVKHLDASETLCDEAELLLFAASRAQLVKTRIIPFLKNGGIVLCDRYADSTRAYQGEARNLNRDLVEQLIEIATGGLAPRKTFLFDLSPEEGRMRLRKRYQDVEVHDRIEAEGDSFHERVRRGFLLQAEKEPERFCVLSAMKSIEELHGAVIAEVENELI